MSKTWVVYRMTLPKQTVCGNVVCEQDEWDAIELTRPGYHVLLYSGIKTEQEAERLARGTAGDTYRSGSAKKSAQTHQPRETHPT
jgi:hypothetical protein